MHVRKMAALMEEYSLNRCIVWHRIKPCPAIDLSRYETIYIGTPVWAGSYTPPIKSFIRQYKIQNKRIALFASHGGNGAEKCFTKLKSALPENKFIGEIAFLEPKKNPEDSSNKAVKWATDLLTIQSDTFN